MNDSSKKNTIPLLAILVIVSLLPMCKKTENTANTAASTDSGTQGPDSSTVDPDDPLIVGAKVLVAPGKEDVGGLVDRWREAGITDAFLKPDFLAMEGTGQALEAAGIRPWLIEQVFFNDENDLSGAEADFFSIKDDGQVAVPELQQGWEDWYTWLEMASPSDKEYRDLALARIAEHVRDIRPYGVSLDFIRYFAFWELIFPDADPASIPDTCFSPESLDEFQSSEGVKIPAGMETPQLADWIHENHQEAWTRFKCEKITEMVGDIIDVVREIDPDIKINVHSVPWRREDFDGAIKRITGQDLAAIGTLADMISPMTYAKMTGNDAAWIHSVVDDHAQVSGGLVPVVPAVQVVGMYGTGDISDQEFESYLSEALKPPSSGVTVWPWEDLTDSKLEILKRVVGPR